jgi:hypothetical protein
MNQEQPGMREDKKKTHIEIFGLSISKKLIAAIIIAAILYFAYCRIHGCGTQKVTLNVTSSELAPMSEASLPSVMKNVQNP